MGKKKNRTKKYRRERQLRQRILIGGLLIAVCCLFGGVFAKYIHQNVTGTSQVMAENFYFTADLLGDTRMVSEDGQAGESFSFGEASTEGTWYLYGAGTHSIDVQIQNFYDALRVTEKDITYRAEVSIQDKNGNTLSAPDGLQVQTADGNLFTDGTLTGGSASFQALTLQVPDHMTWAYDDETAVTVTVASSAPYRKTLTLHFVLYATDTTLKYRVTDSTGSPYAELVIMTNVGGNAEVKPTLVWPQGLSIDNTNKLTFTYENGTFTQMTGMEGRRMQISESLAAGRSETIYFFKSNISEDYSKAETVVNPDNGSYVINLGN